MRPYPINFVSIVIPVYNEQDSLPELLRRTEAACQQLHHAYEIVLVDDGSRDDSAQILEDAASREGSPVVAVILNRNYGQHAAIMAGFEQCKGDVVITLDADLQNPPEEIPRLIEQAELGYDVVATVRNNRQDSALRRWPSKLINLAVQRSTGVAMSDYGCMLRAYRRTIVDAMLACRERSTFIPILANSFARHTTEILVTHAEREHGDSKYSPMRPDQPDVRPGHLHDHHAPATAEHRRRRHGGPGHAVRHRSGPAAPGVRRRLGRWRYLCPVRRAVRLHRWAIHRHGPVG
ncbi:UNVERIFIED_ORG: glycosyltransferase involved in cell wall biosynthesis [Pseudomonas reinekei]|nr:glycosyltransferase involved in cell wall biosynthesis [Pseudomonas reinekei]